PSLSAFLTAPATSAIYTLSLHDALPISFKWKDELAETTLRYIEWSASRTGLINPVAVFDPVELEGTTVKRASVHNLSIMEELELDRKSTRLNSSHVSISYAVFCLNNNKI